MSKYLTSSSYAESKFMYPECTEVPYTGTTEQIAQIIAAYDNMYLKESTPGFPYNTGGMEKLDCEALASYFKNIDFKPFAAYLCKDIHSIRLGHLYLIAETPSEKGNILCFFDFAMNFSGMGSIQEGRELKFLSFYDDAILSCKDDEIYGFGGVWKYPDLDTYEQQNIHGLNQSLRKWSAAEGIKKEMTKLVKKRDKLVKKYDTEKEL